MGTCRSCAFFGGKREGKYVAFYQCLHPIRVGITGGRMNDIKSTCVLHEKRRKQKEETNE